MENKKGFVRKHWFEAFSGKILCQLLLWLLRQVESYWKCGSRRKLKKIVKAFMENWKVLHPILDITSSFYADRMKYSISCDCYWFWLFVEQGVAPCREQTQQHPQRNYRPNIILRVILSYHVTFRLVLHACLLIAHHIITINTITFSVLVYFFVKAQTASKNMPLAGRLE